MTPVVRADGLTKEFGDHRGVREVNLEVGAGEVFGFLGPNGAGKSTTIRLLLGLYRPQRGHATLFGLDPLRDSVRINRRLGYLPGELALFSRLSGREHLERFAHARAVNSMVRRDALIDRFDVELDRPVAALSKGNRQKLGIVLAFMHDPDLLVLDEPTSGLDPLMQAEFAALVRERAADGAAVFLSSHDLDEVQRLVDRLAIIKDGDIIVTDTVEGLRRTAARTLAVFFDHPPPDVATLCATPGVENLTIDDHAIRFSFAGELPPLLRALADLHPVDLTVRPADLDELFLRFYRRQEPARVVDHDDQ
jgi:ABC-2 type transport system ATP-binding protein